MAHTFAHSPEFERLLAGDPGADLTRIAFELARDVYPELDAAPYLARIDALAARVRARFPEGAAARQVIGQINWVLFVEEGFQGNTESYYDARNSYLNEVLDRKTGIPISLSVLYLALADRVGLPMAGMNLPAHFMVRTLADEPPLYVDPFHAGAVLDRVGCAQRIAELTSQAAQLTDDQLAPCPSPVLVARMLRNLKAIYLRENDLMAALPVLRRLAALSEGDPEDRRDLGVVCLHAGRPGESLDHLAAYLAARPEAEDTEAVGALLRAAQRDAAERN